MERKDFLKSIGALGATLPVMGFRSLIDPMDEPTNNDILACTETPEEIPGPYPTPSTVSTSTLVRSNILSDVAGTNTQTGIPLTLAMNILSINGCASVGEGYRVDIWHCNQRGYYSAYAGQPGIDGTVDTTGQTWLRGIQYTDANGQVNFTTIYPGWYTPRTTHIHVQVYDTSNTLILTTQLVFLDSNNTTVNNYYNTSGTNSTTNANDMVVSDSYADEIITVTGSTSAGYTGSVDVYVETTSLGIDDFNDENGGQFGSSLAPNPVTDNAKVYINLLQPSKVSVAVYDTLGRSLSQTEQKQFSQGQHTIDLNTSSLSAGTYLYKVYVSNVNGDFIQTKKFIKK
ncbi:MAG: T9SS type A sorting domain-containing protein [Edaphocola sp.]